MNTKFMIPSVPYVCNNVYVNLDNIPVGDPRGSGIECRMYTPGFLNNTPILRYMTFMHWYDLQGKKSLTQQPPSYLYSGRTAPHYYSIQNELCESRFE